MILERPTNRQFIKSFAALPVYEPPFQSFWIFDSKSHIKILSAKLRKQKSLRKFMAVKKKMDNFWLRIFLLTRSSVLKEFGSSRVWNIVIFSVTETTFWHFTCYSFDEEFLDTPRSFLFSSFRWRRIYPIHFPWRFHNQVVLD